MNFQDELKANAKTQQEKDEEQKQQFYNMLRYHISNIENGMKEKVANADYMEINGKQVVSVFETVPRNLSKCVKQSAQNNQGTVFYIDYPHGWETFYGELKEIAQEDNISIEPIVFFSPTAIKQSNVEAWNKYKTWHRPKSYRISDFPIRINQQNNDHLTVDGFQLCIEATCEIPDQYSSDEFKEAVQPISENEEQQKIEVISIDNIDGFNFESICADILAKNGFENIRMTQESADQGIDILAERDGVKFGIQCKSYSSDVGNAAVQQAYAGKDFYKCHVGVVLTNQHFTRSARELAESNGIILWDRDKLIELFRNAGYQVKE